MELHSCFLLSFAVRVLDQNFEEGKIYSIQNAHDGTYLEVVDTPRSCERRSEVITGKNLKQESEAFRWKYRATYTGTANFMIDRRDYDSSSGYHVNEVTNKENSDSPPQVAYCYPELAEYHVTRAKENWIRIKSDQSDKCLAGIGEGQHISWEPCKLGNWNQFWHFIDLGKPILKFFEHSFGQGDVLQVQLHVGEYQYQNQCYNFPSKWNDKISSVDTAGQCIIVFEHGRCEGESSRIAPGTDHHGHLEEIGFNDKISSVKAC